MGGHGGLNILPQKTWNVYRRDNREKVEKDEELLQEYKRKNAQNKLSDTIKHKTKLQLSDQELFKQAKLDKKHKEKQTREEIKEMLKDTSMTGNDGHFNLFLREEYENHEKDKQMASTNKNNPFLKRTSNLGELFDNNSNPWYSNKNKQLSKYEKAEGADKPELSRYEAKNMLRIGKT